MAGKKGGAVALQTEINNEEDWELLLEKQGLVVVDVYSEWCGPCLGMVGNLKKLKLEIGSDYLHLAVAKSDAIEVLERFRNKSEPTWMFIGSGKMVHIMFGANAPKLMRTIQQELEKELKVLKGEIEREWVPFLEMTAEEKIRAKLLAEKLEEEKRKEEKELADKLEDLKIKSLTKLARKLLTHTLSLYFPHTIEGEKKTCTNALKMLHQYDFIGLMIIDQQEVQLTPADVPELFYNSTHEFPEKFLPSITKKPCLVTLVLGIGSSSVDSTQSLQDNLGKVEEKLGTLVYGSLDPNNPVFNTPAYNFQTKVGDEVWPGIWTPLNYLSKAAAMKVLFPSVIRAIGHEDDKLPPPMYVVIFDATRAREVNEVAEEFPGEVQHMGFFDGMDPETAKKVCKHIKDLERMKPEKIRNTKMVMALSKTTSDPMLALAQLNPLYISPDLKIGSKDAELFFPPDAVEVEFEIEEDIEEEEEEEEEDEEEAFEMEMEEEGEEGLEEEDQPDLAAHSSLDFTEPKPLAADEEEGSEEEEEKDEEEGEDEGETEEAAGGGEPPPPPP